jgi:polyisoprenoid-binding protein YceI
MYLLKNRKKGGEKMVKEEKIFNIVNFPEIEYLRKISKMSDKKLEKKHEKLPETGRVANMRTGKLMRRGYLIYERTYQNQKNTDRIFKMKGKYYLIRWIGTIDIKRKTFKIKSMH